MEISFTHQLWVVFMSLILGAFLGAFYDVIRILRCLLGIRYGCAVKRLHRLTDTKTERTLNPVYESVIMGVTDIMYFTAAACIMAVFVYSVNNGNVRWYIYASSAMGFFAYYATVGRAVISLSSLIAAVIRKGARILVICMYAPFKPVTDLCRRGIGLLRARRISRKKLTDAKRAEENRKTLLHYGR